MVTPEANALLALTPYSETVALEHHHNQIKKLITCGPPLVIVSGETNIASI